MKIKALFAITALFGFMLAGCNTVDGFGKDVQKGGQEIQHAAN